MKQTQKGLNLIEIVIIIAILSVMAAVIVPAYQKYMQKQVISAERIELLGGVRYIYLPPSVTRQGNVKHAPYVIGLGVSIVSDDIRTIKMLDGDCLVKTGEIPADYPVLPSIAPYSKLSQFIGGECIE